MKTSIILVILILFNTTALISEPLALLVKGINTWVLIGLEIILCIGFLINQLVKEMHKVSHIDMRNLKLFVLNNKKTK